MESMSIMPSPSDQALPAALIWIISGVRFLALSLLTIRL
jgi:hypothetical protein